MNLAAWLVSLAPSIIRRVLAALGFGFVTLTGLNLVGDSLAAWVTTSFNGLPADVFGICNLAGLGAGLNIVLGAIAARLALYVLTSSSRVVGVN